MKANPYNQVFSEYIRGSFSGSVISVCRRAARLAELKRDEERLALERAADEIKEADRREAERREKER